MARNLRLYRTLENKHTKDITQCQTNRKFKTYNTIPCKIKLYIYIYIYHCTISLAKSLHS